MKYKDSGVDIDAAHRANKAMSQHVKSTWDENVLSDVGAFGGLFSLRGCKDPVLVSSMDGLGTKVMAAEMAGRFDTVGQDLVNHCVNDILVQGAKPLFFLDYIASGSLNASKVATIVEGVAKACRRNHCALIGGETAEMPGVYQGEDFDLAGCIVGVVERGDIVDGSAIEPGDAVMALPSTGLHTNGYSLARHILFDELSLAIDERVDELGCTVGEELLKVHASYLDPVTRIRDIVPIKGLAHVTGGGIAENLPRILPPNCDARIQRGTWPLLPVFSLLQTQGAVSDAEMYRVFNMGVGMLVVVAAKDAEKLLAGIGEDAVTLYRAGEIVKGERQVRFE